MIILTVLILSPAYTILSALCSFFISFLFADSLLQFILFLRSTISYLARRLISSFNHYIFVCLIPFFLTFVVLYYDASFLYQSIHSLFFQFYLLQGLFFHLFMRVLLVLLTCSWFLLFCLSVSCSFFWCIFWSFFVSFLCTLIVLSLVVVLTLVGSFACCSFACWFFRLRACILLLVKINLISQRSSSN